MIEQWMLIVALFSPGGDFIGKFVDGPFTKAECVEKKNKLKPTALNVQLKGLCVTKDHWDGKKQMTGVALD